MTAGASSSDARIVDTRVRVLRAPSHGGIAMSFAPLTHRTMVLVELETADGLVGYGESWVNYPSWAPTERVATLREGVFPLVLGADARRITWLQRRLVTELAPLGRQWGGTGPIMQAISAVDLALWDLRGKACRQPVSGLGGGPVRAQVPVYASSLGPTGVPEQAAGCRGHTDVKVKLGFGRAEDERILAQAREILGSEVELYADANQAWTVAEAAAMAPLLESYRVAWIEEPIRGNALADLETLHRRTNLPIATGENIYGRGHFRDYAASPAVAVLQPDLAKTGGFTEAWAICELAEAYDKPVWPHLYGGAVAFAGTLQLAGCAPAVEAVEYDIRDNPLRDPLFCAPIRPRAGRIDIPDQPGLGVVLDQDAMLRTATDHATEAG